MESNTKHASSGKTDCPATKFGERFYMDFSFLRVSSQRYKQIKWHKRVVKSRQGYTACLTIVDKYTRQLFGFPTLGKEPPIKLVSQFLDQYGLTNGDTHIIRKYQGGELARS